MISLLISDRIDTKGALLMAYTIDRPSRTYKTWVDGFTITQEIKQNVNQIKSCFNIVSSEHNVDTTTEWVDYPVKNMINLIEKNAPMIKDYLPLIETTDKTRQRHWLCSTFLLNSGKKIKMYMPKTYSIDLLKGAIKRRSVLSLSDGERVYAVKYNEITAILTE